MKLQPDRFDVPSITAYDRGWIAVNGERHTQTLVIGAQGGPQRLDIPSAEAIGAAVLGELATLQTPGGPPEVVLIGTGLQHRLLHPRLTQALVARRIGVECMDTQAACRTYNILVGEGRRVLALLVIET